jgi:hypothetical protein
LVLEQGSNVVATGSGPIDLTGLMFFDIGGIEANIAPEVAQIVTGTGPAALFDLYVGVSSGTTSFGSGHLTAANSTSGDIVGISDADEVLVPHDYISGNALSDSATYDNTNFSQLGATPGTYEWTWGTGPNQSFTLIIGTPTVAEPSSLLLLASALIGLGTLLGVGSRSAAPQAL